MKNLFLVLFAITVTASSSVAQNVGYADVNAILSVMPDNKKINDDLQIYATGLQKRVDDMKAQVELIVKQFNTVLAAGDTAQALELQKKGLEADKLLQQTSQASEQQLAQKRNELLQPVLTKMRGAMETVAKKKGFDYILNSVDGSGTSIVLWGPEGHDVTRAIVDELGIKLEGDVPAPSEKGKKKK
ncbi:MAG: OmpH family outer membrane protein [Flavobacteriales bacterium]